MTDAMIARELKEGVLILTLDRPKANAFNTPMAIELQNAFKDAKKDKAVRSVLLQANGKLFSAGQDVSEFGGDGHVSFRKHLQKTYNPLVLQMRQLEKPQRGGARRAVATNCLGLGAAFSPRPDQRHGPDQARLQQSAASQLGGCAGLRSA